jgi:hypothetical protein
VLCSIGPDSFGTAVYLFVAKGLSLPKNRREGGLKKIWKILIFPLDSIYYHGNITFVMKGVEYVKAEKF